MSLSLVRISCSSPSSSHLSPPIPPFSPIHPSSQLPNGHAAASVHFVFCRYRRSREASIRGGLFRVCCSSSSNLGVHGGAAEFNNGSEQEEDEEEEEEEEGAVSSLVLPERWDVLGLGQAMVDFSGTVDDEFLKNLGLEKGTRKVVNHEERGRVLQAMDGCSYKAAAGGSLSNSLVALARLGSRSVQAPAINVAMAGSVGSDLLGGFYREKLRRANVQFLSAPIKDATTGTVIVLTTPDAQRTMLAYQGTSSTVNYDTSLASAVSKTNILVVEGYLFELPDTIKAITKACKVARSNGALVAITASDVSCIERHFDNFWEIVGNYADLIFANADEARALCNFDAKESTVSVTRYLSQFVPLVSVTDGPGGSYIGVKGEAVYIPPSPCVPVDTCGAGDAYASGILYGVLRGISDLRSIGTVAAKVAATVVGQQGTRLRISDAVKLAESFAFQLDTSTVVMARTRGSTRQRPTASVRRERARQGEPDMDPHPEEEPQDIEEVQAHAVAEEEPLKPPFPGGPEDTSILRSYDDHVAKSLWLGQDRVALKCIAHGRKLKDVPMNDHIRTFLDNSGLAPLLTCSHQHTDKGLCSAFAERWHQETSTFHLPVGELTITLDDVSQLLHIPITGSFFRLTSMTRDTAVDTLVELLGVSYADAFQETETQHCARVRLSWLERVYHEQCMQQHWENAARALLLRLVGSTIFTNKSATSADVVFLELFRDMDSIGGYAWGAGALAYLYDQLNSASFFGCKQLAGYLTLLQGWIFEHFPEMGCQSLNMDYTEDAPRASRWTPGKGPGQAGGYRRALDELTVDDVCWTPYAVHRETRPFQPISMFSGYIRWGSLAVPHLPERVMRQYGLIQMIPRSPRVLTAVHTPAEEMHGRWVQFDQHSLMRFTTADAVIRPGDCVGGYLEWYFSISHPFIISAIAEIRRPLLFPQIVPPPVPQPVPQPTAGSSSQTVDETITQVCTILKSCQQDGFATEGTELWHRIDQCTQLLATLTTGGGSSTGTQIQSEMRGRVEKTYQRKRTRPQSDP